MVTASTPDVPSIMERMVVLSKKDGKELDISELARRFESLEYQVYLMYASNYSINLDKSESHCKCTVLQGGPTGRRLHFFDFDLVVQMSAWAAENLAELACRQHGETPKSMATKHSR